jgi:hypothetical protein
VQILTLVIATTCSATLAGVRTATDWNCTRPKVFAQTVSPMKCSTGKKTMPCSGVHEANGTSLMH